MEWWWWLEVWVLCGGLGGLVVGGRGGGVAGLVLVGWGLVMVVS
ncbi:hypothetical protein A2U01_0072168, partial [Trifolium medium]|nr:hypothetical protein [Trifolium medium]